LSASQQSLADSLAANLEKTLATGLQGDPNKLDAISQFTPSQRQKFASLGKDFAMQVIGNWWSTKKGGKRHALTREEVTESVIEWLSSELSKQISSDIIDYTIASVTKKRLSRSKVEEIVDGSVVFDAPLIMKTITTFEIKFDRLPVMHLDISVDVDAELTVNNAVTKLLAEPVLRIEEIDFRDCEASIVIRGPLGRTLGEIKVPIKGEVIL
jgi:hypothetical protein